MLRTFNFVVGIGAVAQAIAQYLAAIGRLELNRWPFIRTRNRPLRLAAAGLSLVIGMVAIASALWMK